MKEVLLLEANKNDFVEINKRMKIFKNGEFIFAWKKFKEKVLINFNDNLREFSVEKKYNIENSRFT